MEHSCCITGHRKLPADKEELIRHALRMEIIDAVNRGYHTFISGFAKGADLLFADAVAELSLLYDHIRLEAVLPYKDRLKSPDPDFRRLIGVCGDKVSWMQEKYSKYTFYQRNRAIVDASSLVIAVYDGGGGGTAYTVKYAQKRGREIHIINPFEIDNKHTKALTSPLQISLTDIAEQLQN